VRKLNNNAKLTPEDVEHIRMIHRWKEDAIISINEIGGQRALAEKYGVSTTCISHLVNYRTWDK
jgi:hypothetical protein